MWVEVTEVDKLLGGRTPGVDEIHPEFLKALDVLELFWLTCLYNSLWRSGVVPLDWLGHWFLRRGTGRV